MTTKNISVRLAVVGGREVRAELQGIGDAGEQGFRRLSREMDAANSRVAAFYRRVQIAAAAAKVDVVGKVETWYLAANAASPET